MPELLGEWIRRDRAFGPVRYLLVTPAGRYLDLPESAYQLDQHIRAGLTFSDVAMRITERHGRPVTAEEVQAAHSRIAAAVQDVESRAPIQPRTLWFRQPLLSAAAIRRMAGLLAWTFHPWVLSAGLATVSFTLYSFLFRSPGSLGGPTGGVALLILSTMFHEFGHATACYRYGGRPGEIGFGAYWTFPVLYTDVTDSWRLTRKQRVVVDLGGVYFQGLFAVACAVAYVGTGVPALHDGVIFIAVSCVFTLNPFFRFDGYWVLADFLDFPDLDRQPGRLAIMLWRRLRGQPTGPVHPSRVVTAALVVYSLLRTTFFVLFVVFVIPALFRRLLAYPGQLIGLISPTAGTAHRVDLRALPAALGMTFTAVLSALGLFRALRRLTSLRRAEDRSRSLPPPAGREASGVAAP